MFATSGYIDKFLLKQLKFHIITKKQKRVFAVALVFFAGMTVIELIKGVSTMMWLYFACLIILLLEAYFMIGKNSRRIMDRVISKTGKDEARYTSTFLEDKVQISNFTNFERSEVPYEAFTKIVETKDAFFLFTEDVQFVVAFKAEGLERERFLEFIKSRPTQIKWK